MLNAVSGLMNAAAPCAAVMPLGSGRQSAAGRQRSVLYVPPAIDATVRPNKACAAAEAPAATTRPAPSWPMATACPTRPAAVANRRGDNCPARRGTPLAPACSKAASAPQSICARSAGCSGAACTRTKTSSACGTGTFSGYRRSSMRASECTND